jgi:hypothetical protein
LNPSEIERGISYIGNEDNFPEAFVGLVPPEEVEEPATVPAVTNVSTALLN